VFTWRFRHLRRRRYHQPPVRGNDVVRFWAVFAFMRAPVVDQWVSNIAAGAAPLKNYVPACIDTVASQV
jgi:hypothetical protein